MKVGPNGNDVLICSYRPEVEPLCLQFRISRTHVCTMKLGSFFLFLRNFCLNNPIFVAFYMQPNIFKGLNSHFNSKTTKCLILTLKPQNVSSTQDQPTSQPFSFSPFIFNSCPSYLPLIFIFLFLFFVNSHGASFPSLIDSSRVASLGCEK